MRHLRTSRVADRERTISELLGADGGVEAAPIPPGVDEGFSLRPLAAALPGDDVVVADPLGEGTEIDHLLRRAREQVQRGRPAEAAVTYRQLLELGPAHRESRVELARLLENSGDLEGAVEQLGAALKGEPDAADLLVLRGALLGQQKQYLEAESDLRRVLKREPQHGSALFHLGVVQVRKGLPSEGAPTLRRALEVEPLNVAGWYALGEALIGLNELTAAEAALHRALELAPSHPRASNLLGRVLDRLGRTDEAAAMYTRAREGGR
ncbi:MAG: tetratricopeptide repeat protein [Gemmatimonadota bacterium]